MVDATDEVDVQVAHHGPVASRDRRYAADKVLHLIRRTGAPVLFARVRLSWDVNPALARPAAAGAEVDLDGEVRRAHASARTVPEAVDLMIDRLADQLVHRSRHQRAADRRRHGRSPGPAGTG